MNSSKLSWSEARDLAIFRVSYNSFFHVCWLSAHSHQQWINFFVLCQSTANQSLLALLEPTPCSDTFPSAHGVFDPVGCPRGLWSLLSERLRASMWQIQTVSQVAFVSLNFRSTWRKSTFTLYSSIYCRVTLWGVARSRLKKRALMSSTGTPTVNKWPSNIAIGAHVSWCLCMPFGITSSAAGLNQRSHGICTWHLTWDNNKVTLNQSRV